jgi:radical SAM superfamily enzyme
MKKTLDEARKEINRIDKEMARRDSYQGIKTDSLI